MDAARPSGSSAKTRPIPRAARSRTFRRWRAPCSAKKSATPFGPDNPMRRSSRLSEPKSLEQGWLAIRITRSSLQTEGTIPICPTFEILPALHLPRRAFPKNTPNPDIGSARMVVRSNAFVRFKEANMATGTVKFFNSQKGFGFIQQEGGGPDVFVHVSAVERAGMRGLVEGQKVSFDIEADRRSGKSAAANLQTV